MLCPLTPRYGSESLQVTQAKSLDHSAVVFFGMRAGRVEEGTEYKALDESVIAFGMACSL